MKGHESKRIYGHQGKKYGSSGDIFLTELFRLFRKSVSKLWEPTNSNISFEYIRVAQKYPLHIPQYPKVISTRVNEDKFNILQLLHYLIMEFIYGCDKKITSTKL